MEIVDTVINAAVVAAVGLVLGSFAKMGRRSRA